MDEKGKFGVRTKTSLDAIPENVGPKLQTFDMVSTRSVFTSAPHVLKSNGGSRA